MADNLFEQQLPDEPQLDPNAKYFEKLVGPGNKFQDQEALAKGKWYADAQIEIQNRKMDQMRDYVTQLKAELDQRAKFDDLIDRLDKRADEGIPNTITPEVKMDNAPRITPEDIEGIVNRRINETKSADKAQQNFNVVMSKLKERYGNNYQDVLLEQTENLGLTAEDVNALARKSPTAFFKTMGLDQTPQLMPNQTPPRSSTTFVPTSTPKKTWSYYQDMFKKNPKLYYDAKITQEMVQSHAELGDAFKDGDFGIYGD